LEQLFICCFVLEDFLPGVIQLVEKAGLYFVVLTSHVLAVAVQFVVDVIESQQNLGPVVSKEPEFVGQLLFDAFTLLDLIAQSFLRQTEGFRPCFEVSKRVLLSRGVFSDSLVHDLDVFQPFGQLELLVLDVVDLLAVRCIGFHRGVQQLHDSLFYFGLKGCVVGLVLLVVGPPALLLHDLFHLLIDRFFDLQSLFLAHLLVDVDKLLVFTSLRHAKVIPRLFKRSIHLLRLALLNLKLVVSL